MNVSHYEIVGKHLEGIKEVMSSFPVIRVMDWQKTNNSNVVGIKDIVKNTGVFSGGSWDNFAGVSLTDCIEFVNSCDSRMWCCIPHRADDGLIEWMVKTVLENSKNRPIFEYSNEVWNDVFKQTLFVRENGGFDYQIKRSSVIQKYAGDMGDVVVSGQFWNAQGIEKMGIGVREKGFVLGIAPYVGRLVKGLDGIKVKIDIELVLYKSIMKRIIEVMGGGCGVWAYEGGLHLTGNDAKSKEELLIYNRSEEAGEVSRKLWGDWIRMGCGVACPYSVATVYRNNWDNSISGSWFGHCEIADGRIIKLPKYNETELLLMKRCKNDI